MKKINREEFWEQAKVRVEYKRRRKEGREWRKIKMVEIKKKRRGRRKRMEWRKDSMSETREVTELVKKKKE